MIFLRKTKATTLAEVAQTFIFPKTINWARSLVSFLKVSRISYTWAYQYALQQNLHSLETKQNICK